MNIGPCLRSKRATRKPPPARWQKPGRTRSNSSFGNARGGAFVSPVQWWSFIVTDDKDKKAPAPVFSGDPQRELERKLKRDPNDQDAKADVGSDESMDASDPPAAAQPGQTDDPVPSSGFPH
jgi:hypothetical protein